MEVGPGCDRGSGAELTVEKHIDTMGFLIAAIVISISLLGDREARRSEQQVLRTQEFQDKLRETLRLRLRITPRIVSEWVRLAAARPDRVILAARLLNTSLIAIVVIVGLDALRLLYFTKTEGPPDATLLVVGLMAGAVLTGFYGEFHARTERTRAEREFARSDLGLLAKVSESLVPAARAKRDSPQWKFEPRSISPDRISKLEGRVEQVGERFPNWDLVPELKAMAKLVRGDAPAAVETLLAEHSKGSEVYNLPILLTAAMTRVGDLDKVLPRLDEVAARTSGDRVLDELRFDLGLVNAHRDQLFSATAVPYIDEFSEVDPLAFDIPLGDVKETSQLRDFGRAWTDSTAAPGWRPDANPEELRRPISWLWQIINGEEPDGGIAEVRAWRDSSRDAAALQSLGFGCLAVGRGDDAVELFESAIRFDSSSGSAHWGAALSYFQRSWRDKAWTSLKRARICEYSAVICDLTEDHFKGAKDISYEGTTHKFGRRPELAEQLDLSLLGVDSMIKNDGTPRNKFAARFVASAWSTVAVGR
jgi:tetratricopeptide (TPR) repeat protein